MAEVGLGVTLRDLQRNCESLPALLRERVSAAEEMIERYRTLGSRCERLSKENESALQDERQRWQAFRSQVEIQDTELKAAILEARGLLEQRREGVEREGQGLAAAFHELSELLERTRIEYEALLTQAEAVSESDESESREAMMQEARKLRSSLETADIKLRHFRGQVATGLQSLNELERNLGLACDDTLEKVGALEQRLKADFAERALQLERGFEELARVRIEATTIGVTEVAEERLDREVVLAVRNESHTIDDQCHEMSRRVAQEHELLETVAQRIRAAAVRLDENRSELPGLVQHGQELAARIDGSGTDAGAAW